MMAWRLLVTSLAMLALLSGCEVTPARYKVLSFFFDGVPNPEEIKAAELREKAKREAAEGKAGTLGSQHAPYAEKKCNSCHERSTNVLVAPKEELCYRCHKFKTENKWVHGPVVSGGCTVCHDPHSSRYRFLLVSESESFCFYCHDEKVIKEIEAHKGIDAKCTDCHNPHMSVNRYLLK
jgi:predicted CXXCH cytochrome family protein